MSDTMKALVYNGPEKIALQDVPVPKIIEPDDAIVRVTTSTICGTDIHIWHGGMPETEAPRILGHEFVGEVVEIGPAVRNVKVGDKVAVSCVTQCGECFYCRRGIYSHCTTGSWIFGYMIDGCQAEFVRVPHANLGMFHIPEGLTEEDVLFVGDILSTGYLGAENAKIEPGETVVVTGCGPVGMCAMTSARLWGPSQVIAVDLNQERLDFAVEKGIADIGLNPLNVNVPERVRELTEGRGADRTIEACGAKGTYELALDAVRPGGNVSLIGVFEDPQILALNELWIKNINLSMGLVNANRIPELIKLIQTGKINTNHLITHRAPLNDLLTGYDVFGNKKDNCIKWVVTPYEK
ncbi:MAG: alcohol dehydrogenase [Syntrophomonadaceae bacterium]|nr:alcohol dehydrogenase [Syntrophomonadaceae bacterium]MDD3889314.1 alcohol dehydrogenase [Syntrophomonadaceae bacterium]MDD4549688.1 alcohol dehydrogenase [Syntrophomonadaceae bacterium]